MSRMVPADLNLYESGKPDIAAHPRAREKEWDMSCSPRETQGGQRAQGGVCWLG